MPGLISWRPAWSRVGQNGQVWPVTGTGRENTRFKMSETVTIAAEIREDVGKGASRRLRREGKVPGVIYGSHSDPVALTIAQNELLHAAENEAFYASILEIEVGDGRKQQAIVRDMQRHPFKPIIMH
ncbi:MAG: 50S ribosomal protein L25, partial [Xanthomonadales bacterium]|nr:50S ribosomal protein L25 [Xanthomonadales bacterium]